MVLMVVLVVVVVMKEATSLGVMDVLLIVVGAEVVPELIVPTGAPVPRYKEIR
jgi:hypothetical protein